MTPRTAAFGLAALTIAGLVIGAMITVRPSMALLPAAEGVKLGSAVLTWIVAAAGGRPLLARLAAVLMGLAALAGFGAIAAESHAIGALVTPLALASLVAVAAWGIGVARGAGSPLGTGLAALLLITAIATWFLPPAGLLAALTGIAWWAVFALRIGRARA